MSGPNPHSEELSEIIRAMGDVSEWSHNVAQFSSRDFAGFDPSRPLRESETLLEPHSHLLKGALLTVIAQLSGLIGSQKISG